MVQDAVTGFPVFAFLALRFGLAALVLLPFFCAAGQPAPVSRCEGCRAVS